MEKQSIMITGVMGLVGSCLYRRLVAKPEQYDVYGIDCSQQISERVHPDEAVHVPDSHFTQSDLSDIASLEQALQGIDTVVHLAGDPNSEAPWESVLKNNIVGSYHLFEAAKRAGVRRVIYASTIQVSFGHYANVEPYKSIRDGNYDEVPDSFERVTSANPTSPVNLYGSSKVFGESLARMYSNTTELSCICLRVGGVHSLDEVPKEVAPNACTRNDITRLLECCIRAPDTLKFEILYGASENECRWVDLERAKEAVGYVPEDTIPLNSPCTASE